jgi:hypothetical protein
MKLKVLSSFGEKVIGPESNLSSGTPTARKFFHKTIEGSERFRNMAICDLFKILTSELF